MWSDYWAYLRSDYWPWNLRTLCTKCPLTNLRKHYKTRHFGPSSYKATQNLPKFRHCIPDPLRKKKTGRVHGGPVTGLAFFWAIQVFHLGSFISFSLLFEFFFLFFLILLRCNAFFFLLYLFSSIFYTYSFSIVSLLVIFFSSSSLLVLLFLSCS